MTQQATTRPMSIPERQHLERVVETVGGRAARLRLAVGNAVVSWAGSLLIVFVVWLSVAWPARLMGGLDIGLQSPFAPWIFALAVPLCAVYAVVATILAMRRQRDLLPALEADLQSGRVAEESYRFTEARRFQRPDHGGLTYFLRTPDDRVFVLHDSESETLDMRRQDPLTSRFRPCSALSIVRAPRSGVVLGRSFSGEELDAGDPSLMFLPPSLRPESDACWDVPWAELEQRLGGGS